MVGDGVTGVVFVFGTGPFVVRTGLVGDGVTGVFAVFGTGSGLLLS